ncbi:MAG: signal peptidase I [Planctomycetota bacterium]|nr:signal peptidase I [Planctomycetota bacterium]
MKQYSQERQSGLGPVRDTVESIWVAIMLALVLRAFMVEAFVIPTGSMAPRLMGEHWDLRCPQCGYEYAFGLPREAAQHFSRSRKLTPTGATCPNCGHPYPYTARPAYVNGGDRVLVLKYIYSFKDPRPWDVVVFRNPQNNRENYIKRLIGMPGETIEIVHGNIFFKAEGDSAWQIREKPLRAQREMWQILYDNDYHPSGDVGEDRSERWRQPRWRVVEGAEECWDLAGFEGRRFAFHGGPGPGRIAFQAPKGAFLPHYGYNLPRAENSVIDAEVDICSDLKLSSTFVPKEPRGRVTLMLTSFEHEFQAELHTDGTAFLRCKSPDGTGGKWVEWGRRRLAKPLQVDRGYALALTHVDLRVTFEIDGEPVLVSTRRQYSADYDSLKKRLAELPDRPIPTPRIAIETDGGRCELWHVRLLRDVYYTCPTLGDVSNGVQGHYARRLRRLGLLDVRKGMTGWGTTDNPIALARHADRPDLDEFFVLGDNSPQSLDGRAWTSAAPSLRLWQKNGRILRTYENGAKPLYQLGTVPRYNMIGRALLVYWPSGFRLPGLPGLPLLPNVGKMRLVR